ncbi:hypothetical protein ACUXZZ_45275 (plasmid) [Streptomyces graminifolii]|uniref:hypothetical protein n=1 Tax=Streptomyces graminifolii TaxID=1266771 RepID=UPI004057CC9E
MSILKATRGRLVLLDHHSNVIDSAPVGIKTRGNGDTTTTHAVTLARIGHVSAVELRGRGIRRRRCYHRLNLNLFLDLFDTIVIDPDW